MEDNVANTCSGRTYIMVIILRVLVRVMGWCSVCNKWVSRRTKRRGVCGAGESVLTMAVVF